MELIYSKFYMLQSKSCKLDDTSAYEPGHTQKSKEVKVIVGAQLHLDAQLHVDSQKNP